MPRQQVYGKRSRAVYDPFAVFASPQHAATFASGEVEIQQVIEQVSRMKISGNGEAKKGPVQRRALGERNANSVVLSKLPHVSTKPKRRKPKKTVEENKVVVEGQSSDLILDAHLPSSLRSPDTQCSDDTGSAEAQIVKKHDTPRDAQWESTQENEAPAVAIPFPQADEWEDILPAAAIQTSPTPHTTDPFSIHCADLLSLGAHDLTSFSEWSSQLTAHFTLTKIAEASFGEVYRLSLIEQIDTFSRSDESVFKVIALKPPPSSLPKAKKKRAAALKAAELMSKPEDVANEVKLLQRMSCIPGFTNFRDVRVLQGRPPPAFVKAFAGFNVSQKAKQKEVSVFPDPGKKASYGDTQLWAVIEMQDAGTDLERYVESGHSTSIWSVWDIFWQVVLSLAKGEEGAEFEHRDLHLGNICVRERPTPTSSQTPAEAKVVDPTHKKLNFTPLETTLIDYTISRALMPDSSTAYHDLAAEADTALFEGDSTEEYQYDIYRYMRGLVIYSNNALADPLAHYQEQEQGQWRDYHPITNLVWLHFVLYKLLEQVEWPSAGKVPARKFREARREWKRSVELEEVLLRVQGLLEPEVLGRDGEGGVRAASDLVGLALAEGWLDVEDVVGEEGGLEEDEVDGAADELAEKLQMLVVVDEVPEPPAGATDEVRVSAPRTRRKK